MSRPVLPAPSYDKETAAAFNAIFDRVLRDNPELQKLVTYVEEEGGRLPPFANRRRWSPFFGNCLSKTRSSERICASSAATTSAPNSTDPDWRGALHGSTVRDASSAFVDEPLYSL
eukprot:jgi/Mesvir1/13061/Mv06047-RA.1